MALLLDLVLTRVLKAEVWGVLHAWQVVARATIERAAEVEIFMVDEDELGGL